MKPALTQEQPDKPCVTHKKNLDTIVRAARNGDLGLVEVQLAATGERLAALTAFSKDGDEIVMTPLAVLFNGNPYEMLNPPNPDGGFHSQEEVRGEEVKAQTQEGQAPVMAEHISCSRCGKSVSTPVPSNTIAWAFIECPECIDQGQKPAAFVFEVVDDTDHETFWPIGVWLDLDAAIQYLEGLQEPPHPTCTIRNFDFCRLTVKKRELGANPDSVGTTVFHREFTSIYNEPEDRYDGWIAKSERVEEVAS